MKPHRIVHRLRHGTWLVLFACLTTNSLAAAGAPTKGEWAPLEAALAAEEDGVRQRLADFMQGRTWADGWVILADLDWQSGDLQAAAEHAQQGLSQALASQADNDHLAEVRTRAAALAIRARTRLGRADEAGAIVSSFGRRRDIGGEVHAALAQALRTQNRIDEAQAALATAMAACQDQGLAVPPDYRYLQGTLFEAQARAQREAGASNRAIEALQAAADSYARAMDSDQADTDALFNLARLQRHLAELVPDRRAAHLQESLESYQTLRRLQPEDREVQIGLGLVLLDLERPIDAHNAFADVINAVIAGAPLDQTSLATAYRGRGCTILQLAEQNPQAWSYTAALADLQEARRLGDDSADLWTNLLVTALHLQNQAGDSTEAERYAAIAAEAMAEAGDTASLNIAWANYQRAGSTFANADGAAEDARDGLLQEAEAAALASAAAYAQAVDAVLADPSGWRSDDRAEGPGWRYLGHALRMLSRIQSARGTSDQAAETQDAALAAYRLAGDLVDHDGRRHYLFLACQAGSATGYHAGWRMVGWKSGLTLSGWAAVIGNYGGSGAWKQPLHLILWGLLIGVPLLISLKGLLIGKPAPAPAARGNRPRSAPQRQEFVDDSGMRDSGFNPNSAANPYTGALERRDGAVPQRKPAASASTSPATPADKAETMGYQPLTAKHGEQGATTGTRAPAKPGQPPADKPAKAAKPNKAAQQVAKRLAQEREQQQAEQAAGRSRRPPPRRRRR